MKFFKLFACCIPVKGYSVSIICDLQRDAHIYIPETLHEILTIHRDKPITEIKRYYDGMFNEQIVAYFEYLVSNEYGFYCDNPDRFPAIDLSFETPEVISSAIIDFNARSAFDYAKGVDELDFLGCRYLEFRFYDVVENSEVIKVLETTHGKRFKNLDLYLPYSAQQEKEEFYQGLVKKFHLIDKVIIHSAPENKSISREGYNILFFVKQRIYDETCCGFISRNHFVYNIKAFAEAQTLNSCLNKKISINAHGRIKNCPSLNSDYGSIDDTMLAEVAFTGAFQEIWQVNKDQIKVCRDCQFRYICTDCRAFLSEINDKPQKCKYDPYQNVWA